MPIKPKNKKALKSCLKKISITIDNSKGIFTIGISFLLVNLSTKKPDKINENIDIIEVYDNSHIQGTDSVGALICFSREGFIKKRYRKFNIKKKDNEQDDYGMMREVLNRRFKRAIQEKDNFLSFPDLVMIDGGKGQYSSARETMNELGLHDIPVIAIAKGKYRNSGNETFFHNGKDYKFEKNDPTLFFLQRIRD